MGNTASVVRYVGSGIFVVVSVLAFLLLKPPRYSWRITALGVAVTSLLASSPGLWGRPPTVIFEGIVFNQLGVVAGYLCLLTAFFPPIGDSRVTRRREIRDALLAAAVLMWITFVKANFVAQNLTLLLAVFVLHRWVRAPRRASFWGVLAGGYVLLTLLFILVFQVNVAGMVRDLRIAAASRAHFVLSGIVMTDPFGQGAYKGPAGLYLAAGRTLMVHQTELMLLAIGFLAGMAAVAILGRTSLRRVAAYGVMLLVVVAWDFFQGLFNTYGHAMPLLPLLWLMVMCLLERGEWIQEGAPAAETARQTRNWVGGLAALMVGWHILLLGVTHVSAFVYNTGLSERVGRDYASAAVRRDESFKAQGWDQLYYSTPVGEGKTNSYVARVNDGLELLRAARLDKQPIFVMDQLNPFPFLLGAPYPDGQPVWLHGEATFNRENYWPAEFVLRGAGVVMVPKQPLNPLSLYELSELYESHVRANFTPVAQDDAWIVYQRNPTR